MGAQTAQVDETGFMLFQRLTCMPKLDAALIDALGEPMPELEQLSAANQKKLAADLAAAHQAHDAFLKQSMDNALEHIPRLNTELRRLAQALHKSADDLAYLDKLDAVALQKLRTNFQNSLLNKFGPVFERIAGAGKLAPDSISATLCTKVFGPAITANMSYFTPMSKAVSLCKLFDADFMAEVAREQIPERAVDMLAELPVEQLKKVTAKLVEHGDFHVLGGFTDYIPEKKAIEIMEVIKDPAANLHISFYAQRKDRI
eukprot:gene40036-54129_t